MGCWSIQAKAILGLRPSFSAHVRSWRTWATRPDSDLLCSRHEHRLRLEDRVLESRNLLPRRRTRAERKPDHRLAVDHCDCLGCHCRATNFSRHAPRRHNPRFIRSTLSPVLNCCGRRMAAPRSMERWWWTCGRGKIWGFPTLAPQSYPSNGLQNKPPVSRPFELGRFAFEDINK